MTQYKPYDFLWVTGANGDYDLSIKDGVVEIEEGIRPAILNSLFCDARNSSGSQRVAHERRGWFGSIIPFYNKETGSQLWTLEQKRMTEDTRNLLVSYLQEALKWMVDLGLISKPPIVTSISSSGSKVNVSVKIETETFSFSL
jgi:phage gp46-like protein